MARKHPAQRTPTYRITDRWLAASTLDLVLQRYGEMPKDDYLNAVEMLSKTRQGLPAEPKLDDNLRETNAALDGNGCTDDLRLVL